MMFLTVPIYRNKVFSHPNKTEMTSLICIS